MGGMRREQTAWGLGTKADRWWWPVTSPRVGWALRFLITRKETKCQAQPPSLKISKFCVVLSSIRRTRNNVCRKWNPSSLSPWLLIFGFAITAEMQPLWTLAGWNAWAFEALAVWATYVLKKTYLALTRTKCISLAWAWIKNSWIFFFLLMFKNKSHLWAEIKNGKFQGIRTIFPPIWPGKGLWGILMEVCVNCEPHYIMSCSVYLVKLSLV